MSNLLLRAWNDLWTYHPAPVDKFTKNNLVCTSFRVFTVVLVAISFWFMLENVFLCLFLSLFFGISMVIHELNKSRFLKYNRGAT